MSNQLTDKTQVVQSFFSTRKWLRWLSSLFIAALLGLILFWMLFLNHVGINYIGVAYNMNTGKVHVQDEPGWYFTNPFTFVYDISTVPMKVELPSEAKVINVKYVRFRKEGVEEFIRLQGFNYLSGSSSLQNVLMGYAFSGKEFPFLEVIAEAGPESGISADYKWTKESDKSAGEKK